MLESVAKQPGISMSFNETGDTGLFNLIFLLFSAEYTVASVAKTWADICIFI
ncbi:MAG: hypothetical protein K0R23_2548 [Lacrimispora sp.]|jgi:hypothetical protein|nr:hypothetical protein [Lacrimispora sp.]